MTQRDAIAQAISEVKTAEVKEILTNIYNKMPAPKGTLVKAEAAIAKLVGKTPVTLAEVKAGIGAELAGAAQLALNNLVANGTLNKTPGEVIRVPSVKADGTVRDGQTKKVVGPVTYTKA